MGANTWGSNTNMAGNIIKEVTQFHSGETSWKWTYDAGVLRGHTTTWHVVGRQQRPVLALANTVKHWLECTMRWQQTMPTHREHPVRGSKTIERLRGNQDIATWINMTLEQEDYMHSHVHEVILWRNKSMVINDKGPTTTTTTTTATAADC